MTNPFAQCKQTFTTAAGDEKSFYSLPELQKILGVDLSRMPICLRVALESLLRNCDGKRVTKSHVESLANWQPTGNRTAEVPFVVARVILQDFTGVPLLADLAAMREEAARRNKPADCIEPLVPVDLVVDHSIQVDHYGKPEAMRLNMEIEFERNRERYAFLKWGMGAFQTFKVVPPGVGIVHQVNLEHLARVVMEDQGMCYPDTVVGTDSHTTMINGIGVVGWGVGGIEAEAAMLGQPVYMLEPDVVGVNLTGALSPGVTATDLVLTVTELLRNAKVVGKFVEFFGEGARLLSVPDRATIGNMSEYGATMGFFPADEKTLDYLRSTGRDENRLQTVEAYYQAQDMFGIADAGQCDYTQILTLDLSSVEPSVAGPKRPQDRIPLRELKQKFTQLYSAPVADSGYEKSPQTLTARYSANKPNEDIGDGDVLIAAITSCTNTSNPSVLLAAGLLAQKAVALGLQTPARVKTSLAPGSRVVSDYLEKSGLLAPLEQLGFYQVGYGCTTCIGNSGPIDSDYEKAMADNDIIGVSVLSGNRNFEARVHQNVRANFLMSPPLVVAFAIAGRIDIDMTTDPLGKDKDGNPVYLRDIWPSNDEISAVIQHAIDPQNFNARYAAGFEKDLPLWGEIDGGSGAKYEWRADSTYIQMPPFLVQNDESRASIVGARALALLGDSVTTDHISPAGAIKPSSPAGIYLRENGVKVADYNSYGSRRGNHEVMMRGTFANVRIRNLMTPEVVGGVTCHYPDGEQLPIFDAAMRYQQAKTPLLIFAGSEYGTGSSRDWAAKGTRLLGVKAVIARSYERIHRSNLAGMGVLPCQFIGDDSIQSLELCGDETFDLQGVDGAITPRQEATLQIHRANGSTDSVTLLVRVDTPTECEYFAKDGILPFVLEQLVA
ncbi:MAG: aconitate hydratase AcnA [Gammaproteobacteria bacterium WSBS_2016_MAG_OTU1]